MWEGDGVKQEVKDLNLWICWIKTHIVDPILGEGNVLSLALQNLISQNSQG